MLTLIRNHAQSWIIKVLLGAVVLVFIFSFGVGTFSNPKQVLVKMDGGEILVPEYREVYQRRLEELRRSNPGNADMIARQINLPTQVLEELVNRKLVLVEAERRGLQVSDYEVEEVIKSLPAFQVGNRFDYNTYVTLLRQNSLTVEGYENGLRDDLLVQKYTRNMMNGVMASSLEVDQGWKLATEKVAVKYVPLEAAPFRKKVSVAKAELEAYYKANPQAYRQPEQYKVRYFTLSLDQLMGQVILPEKAVRRYYERNGAEYAAEASVRASHILTKVSPRASQQERDKARKIMEDLQKQIKGGADFAALARKHSQDISSQKGGDLGFFSRGEMVPAFEEAAFSLPVGGVSAIVETQFGLHLIKVTGKKEAQQRSFESVEKEIRQKLISQRAERKLDLEADRLGGRIQQEGIDKVAAELKVRVTGSDWFNDQSILPGLGNASGLYPLVAGRKQGEASVWRRNPVLGHVFFQISAKKEAYTLPFEQVAAKVEREVVDQKARQLALDSGRKAVAGFAAKGDLAKWAAANGLSVKSAAFSALDRVAPEVGANEPFIQKAFSLGGQRLHGFVEGGGQPFLLELTGRQMELPKQAGAEKMGLRATLQAQWERFFQEKEFRRLRKESGVELVAPDVLNSL